MLLISVALNIVHPELTNHVARSENPARVSKSASRDWLESQGGADDSRVAIIP